MGRLAAILLLFASNVFMTYAWYGHLRDFRSRPLLFVILLSWSVALLEYCLQVPANRIGYRYFSLAQLKVIQEVITMTVFAGFATVYMREHLRLDYLWAGLCLVAAAFFMFRGAPAPLAHGAAAVPERQLEVIAHRGLHNPDENGGPQNTLAAFERVIEEGVDWAEFDVHTTADDVLVVIHNSTIDATSNGTGRVSEMTLAELRTYDFGDGQRIPTLTETLELLHDGAGAYLEIKSASSESVIEHLRATDMLDQTVIYAGLSQATELRRLEPKARIMVNRPPADLSELRAQAAELRPQVYGSSQRDITQAQVDSCHAVGTALWVNSMAADDPEGWRRLVEMGADAIETDRPVACVTWLREQGLHR